MPGPARDVWRRTNGSSGAAGGAQAKSFADKSTCALFSGRRVRSLLPDIHRRAYAKLQALDAADTLDFLRVPPVNRLEQLRGNRDGQWSIRINDQWRICFRWEERDAYDVEVTDYH